MEKTGIAASIINHIERLSVPFREHRDRAWKMLSFSPLVDFVAPPKCASFSIEQGCIRAVYGSRRYSRYQVHACKTYPSVSGGYPGVEEVASIISVAVTEMKAEHAQIVLCIPKEWVLIRSAMLPLAAAENLQQVVAFEFDRLTPFSADEAAFDFIEKKPDAEGLPITLAAARVGLVMDYVGALAEKQLTVSRISCDVSALSSLVAFLSGKDSFDFAEVAAHSVRGGSTVDAALESAFARDNDAEGVRLSAGDILSLLETSESFPGGASPGRASYLLLNDSAGYLKDSMASGHGTTWQLLEDSAMRLQGMDSLGSCAAAAGSLVEHLRPDAKGLNLLSQGVRSKARPPIILTGLLLAALLICVGIYVFMPLQIEEQRLKEIERQIALRKDEVRAVEKIKKEIDDVTREMALVENFRKEKPLYINIVREITQLIPKNAWLTRVRISGTQVNLEGYSPSASALIEVLEASKYFQKVEFASPTFRDARLNADRFQIKMELEGTAPEKQAHEKK